MEVPFTVEIEPEVRLWPMDLPDTDYLVVEQVVGLLLDAPTTLGEPYARHLGSGMRELRFSLGHDREPVRLSYRLAPDRRIILLTVFRKTRRRERAEVERAQRAAEVCGSEHGPAVDVYTRDI
ncbi:type II toxin-antitoxin system RelE/ParE family toxin [Streptomyces sp. NPDC059985]|uniref:type II toxin-antitoxin system RelE/ParE family toxin n=1 Tax=Streptomyces sp. NPDC059985 TaxID=3347025 RepID=UPI0036CB0623